MDITIKAGEFTLYMTRNGHECQPFFKGEMVDCVMAIQVTADAKRLVEAVIELEVINDEEAPMDFIRAMREAGFHVNLHRVGKLTMTESMPPKDILKKHGTTVVTDT